MSFIINKLYLNYTFIHNEYNHTNLEHLKYPLVNEVSIAKRKSCYVSGKNE